jgi:hypothetical protein
VRARDRERHRRGGLPARPGGSKRSAIREGHGRTIEVTVNRALATGAPITYRRPRRGLAVS